MVITRFGRSEEGVREERLAAVGGAILVTAVTARLANCLLVAVAPPARPRDCGFAGQAHKERIV